MEEHYVDSHSCISDSPTATTETQTEVLTAAVMDSSIFSDSQSTASQQEYLASIFGVKE